MERIGDLWVHGLRGKASKEDHLFTAKRSARIAPILPLRADRIVGMEHVLAAHEAAKRAFEEGRSDAKDFGIEVARYASGRRQIAQALDHIGVADDLEEVLLLAWGDKGKDAILYYQAQLGFPDAKDLPRNGMTELLEFGITALELDATHPDRQQDLIFERIAKVDVAK